ncbi:MAG: hypothetical protein IT388_01400 [Nitrospirales bacterium]|nr:hypothetical protein [Nitrospirales bacterium]
MKIFEMKERARGVEGGEAIVGSRETGSHACYMLYGILKPGERERVVRPGKGHEEILIAVKGDLEVTGMFSGVLREGSAFHFAGEDACYLENKGPQEAVYIIAGGHAGEGHHH